MRSWRTGALGGVGPTAAVTGTARRGTARWGTALTALALALVAAFASPAAASNGAGLAGCRGTVTSNDRAGAVIDEATGEPVDDVKDADGQPAFTRSNPFVVRSDGTVAWQGETDDLLLGGRWSLDVWGLSLAEGQASNADRSRSGEGVLEIDDVVPGPVTGLVKVDGRLHADGDDCAASGWVRLAGSPVLTWPWFAGLALVGAGIALAVVAQPRKVWPR